MTGHGKRSRKENQKRETYSKEFFVQKSWWYIKGRPLTEEKKSVGNGRPNIIWKGLLVRCPRDENNV